MSTRVPALSGTLASTKITYPQRRLSNMVMIFVSASLLFAVPVIPEKLQLGTAVCIGLFPFVLRDATRDLRLRLLVVSAILWACGQVVSDKVNGLGFELSLPLALAVTVLVTTTALVYLARGGFGDVRLLAVSISTGLILWSVVFEHTPVSDPLSWKFGLNVSASVILLSLTDLAWRRGSRVPSFVALAVICALGLWSDSRGFTGIALITGLLLFLPRGRRLRDPRTFLAAGCTALLLGAISILIVDSAQAGLLGQRSVSQVREYGSDPVSILVNVRPELYQELSLFLQRPLTGFGSRPHLSTAVFEKSLAFVQSAGVTDIDSVRTYWLQLDTPGVSSHSMAADSWARAGASAVPFWILVVVLALWAGTHTLESKSSPLVVMWTMLVLWDTFFSPLPVAGASTLSAYLAVAIVTITGASKRSSASLTPVDQLDRYARNVQ